MFALIHKLVFSFLQLEEEEEIKRMRKELIPKAQPMPCFDRPFVLEGKGYLNPNIFRFWFIVIKKRI